MQLGRLKIIALLMPLLFSVHTVYCESDPSLVDKKVALTNLDITNSDSEFIQPSDDEKLNTFFQKIFQTKVDSKPEYQTFFGIKTNYDQWNDRSIKDSTKLLSVLQERLDYIYNQIDYDSLQQKNQLNYRLFEFNTKRSIQALEFKNYHYIAEPLRGIQTFIPKFLITRHHITSVSDATAYIKRVEKVTQVIEQSIEKIELQAENNIFLPRFLYQDVYNDIDELLSGYPIQGDTPHPLYKDFYRKISTLSLPDIQSRYLVNQLSLALNQHFVPAYQKLRKALESVETVSPEHVGAWKHPNGDQFYSYRLKRMTTLDIHADDIHLQGIKEVKRIHNEMLHVVNLIKTGLQDHDFEGPSPYSSHSEFLEEDNDITIERYQAPAALSNFFDELKNSDQFFFEDSSAGRQQLLVKTEEYIHQMRQKLPLLFSSAPQTNLQVKRVESFREKRSGTAFYQRPSGDGEQPGVYYLNLHDLKSLQSYRLEALTYHEALPGHHMQISIAQKLYDQPAFRRYSRYTAYSEGWGLYAERLAKEIGLYKNPYSDFGRLSMELWRACRLVVDSGLHAKRWTRQQAIDFLARNTPNDSAYIDKSVTRYILKPGQATAYTIGMLKILEMRAHMKEQLQEDFDIRLFHELILQNGPMPLDMLSENIEQWLMDHEGPVGKTTTQLTQMSPEN